MARTLVLSPATASPGSSVSAAGQGCLPGETGALTAPDGVTKLAAYTADATGKFTVSFPAPTQTGTIAAVPDALPKFGALFTSAPATLKLTSVQVAPSLGVYDLFTITADATLDVKTVTLDTPQGTKIGEAAPDPVSGHVIIQVHLKASTTYPTGDTHLGLWLRGWNVPAGNPGNVPNPGNTGFVAVPTVTVGAAPPPTGGPVVSLQSQTVNPDATVDMVVATSGGVVEVQAVEAGQPVKRFPVDAATGRAAVHLP
jgi:hypothetical protein